MVLVRKKAWRLLSVHLKIRARDLLDKVDDTSQQPWLYPHERPGEREPIARR